MKNKWICGLYCRLSVEDKHNRESNSIQSQKIILTNHVNNLKDATLEKTYVDDGFSGSNFDRPAFKQMINDIEEGLINCVIVKDYSRFGRDYIDVGYYIEKYFPDKDVRFISVNDNHDSLSEHSHDDLKMPIMNMFNDLQSRETSKKVRYGLKARKEAGKFIGAFAPYGYLKSTEDRNKLIIDKNVSHIIKQIFAWRAQNYSTYAITVKLNNMKLPTPTTYKNSIGINHNPANVKESKVVFWNETTVRKILANEAYIGNVVQNKRTTKNHRTKRLIDLDESKWIRVENVHEPIIDITTWNKVQGMVNKRTRVPNKSSQLTVYAGLIKCKDCGHAMIKKSNGKGYVGFTCSTHMADKRQCTTHTISEKILNKVVFTSIMLQIKLAIDVEALLKELKNKDGIDSEIKIYNSRMKDLKNNKEFQNKMLNDIYFDLKKELISEEQYIELKKSTEKKLKELTIEIKKLENEKPKEELSSKLTILDIYEKVENKKELTREMVYELIDCIYIHNNKIIEIDFKYADELDRAKEIIDLNKNFQDEKVI